MRRKTDEKTPLQFAHHWERYSGEPDRDAEVSGLKDMAMSLAESNGMFRLRSSGKPSPSLRKIIGRSSICFRIFDISIQLEANVRGVIDLLMSRFALKWRPASTAQVDRCYSVSWNGQLEVNAGRLGCILLSVGHQPLICATSLDELYDAFESDLLYFVGQHTREMLFLHAGVVAWEREAIVIPGRSYSGKTTLVRALLQAGGVYYSDEYAIVDRQGNVHPFPRNLSIRLDAGGLSRTPAAKFGAFAGGPPLAVSLVVVTRYRSGAQWRPKSLSPGLGMLRLLRNTLSARHCPGLALTILERMVRDATILESERGDADDTARRIMTGCRNLRSTGMRQRS